MKLNKRFYKNIQIAEDLNGIIAKGNVAVALRWTVIQKLEIRSQN